jgi:hypothetical protein
MTTVKDGGFSMKNKIKRFNSIFATTNWLRNDFVEIA